MIVFIDESYQRDSSGVWHYALAGFGINEFRYRALQTAVYKLIRQYFDVQSNYPGDKWRDVLGEKIISETPPDDIELKSSLLLKAGSLRRFGGEQSPHYRLASDLLKSVAVCRGTCFGVLCNPVTPEEVKDCTKPGCPRVYVKLIEKVARWTNDAYPGQSVMLALDTEHNGVNLPLSRSIASYLYRSKQGPSMRHVFPSPFWIDSKSMAGSQVADLIAHILMNSMMPIGEQKPLRGLWQQVMGLKHMWDSGRGGTITRLTAL